jgi:hypothetical protein
LSLVPPSASATDAGTLNVPPVSGVALVRLTNAAPFTLDGLSGGTNGQLVTVLALGAGAVTLPHLSAAAPVGSKLSNAVSSGPTMLAGGALGASATYRFDATSGLWRLIEHEQGAPITPAFNAADYTGNGAMTWTVDAGDVPVMNFYLKGTRLFVGYFIQTTTPGGVANTLLQRIVPNGYVIAFTNVDPPGQIVDNLVTTTGGYADASASTQLIRWGRNAPAVGTPWTLGANIAGMAGSISFNVN